MVELFQQGGSYNRVNYGEYVIIDTIVNDNHYGNPENGIIYRRGLDFNEPFNPNNTQGNEIIVNENGTVSKEDVYPEGYSDSTLVGKKIYYIYGEDPQGNQTLIFDEDKFRSVFGAFVQRPGGGAQYVGQIVGPQGEAPEISLIHWDEFLEKYQDPAAADMNKSVFIADPPPGVQFDTQGNVVDGSIKDTIDYGYLDIKDADGNITGAYISLNIPYSVFKYHAESIEPYDTGYAEYNTTEKVWKYTNLISEDEISKNHNYFWQYDIKIPKGVRGQDLEEFDVHIDPNLISQDGNDILPGADNNNYRYYRIYRNYERSAQGTPILEYINSWQRTIHKITSNGTIPEYNLIQRSTEYDTNARVFANGLGNHLCLVAIVGGITSSEALPALETFEKGKIFVDGTVTWQVIEDTVIPPNLLTIHYTHGENDEVRVRLLDDIIINKNNGKIYAKYSDLNSLVYLGENQSIIGVEYVDTPWIDPVGIQHTINRICIKYNTYNYDEDGRVITDANFSLDDQGNLIFPTTDRSGRRIQFIDEQFKFLERIETDSDTKDVIAYYNDGTSNSLGVLKAIQDIKIKNEGDLGQSKYLTVQYNNLIYDDQHPDGRFEEDEINQHPLNQVACIRQYGDNIILLYSDPNVRKTLYRAGIDYAIPNTYVVPNYQLGSGDDDNNGNLYWINLGSIYHSNHVFGKYTDLDDLKNDYPYGLEKDEYGQIIPEHKDHAGWIVPVENGQGDITLYAYNYLGTASPPEDNWYPLADMSASAMNPEWSLIVSKPGESPNIPPVNKNTLLQTGGYWFVISERAD